MLSELMAAASSVKTMKEMLKTALDAKTYEAVNAVLIKATDELIAAQNLIFKLQADKTALADALVIEQKKIRAQEQELVRLTKWDEERVHYYLAEVATGAFAYIVKRTDNDSGNTAAQSRQWLCCQCYDMGYKSVFQFSKWQSHSHRQFVCPRCQSVLVVETESSTPVVTMTSEPRRGFRDY